MRTHQEKEVLQWTVALMVDVRVDGGLFD